MNGRFNEAAGNTRGKPLMDQHGKTTYTALQ